MEHRTWQQSHIEDGHYEDGPQSPPLDHRSPNHSINLFLDLFIPSARATEKWIWVSQTRTSGIRKRKVPGHLSSEGGREVDQTEKGEKGELLLLFFLL